MLHALRNLIAFVFLLGIFWFIYRDPDNIWNPGFQLVIGGLVFVFALFWFFVPALVVKMRIIRRIAKNRRGYLEWRRESPRHPSVDERLANKARVRLGEGERMLWHERGTLYVDENAGFDGFSVFGRPGDVAFPRVRDCNRKIQRVHCYLTDRRLFFQGKELDLEFFRTEAAVKSVTPGGIVFAVRLASVPSPVTLAFTFQNPLIVAELLGTVSAK